MNIQHLENIPLNIEQFCAWYHLPIETFNLILAFLDDSIRCLHGQCLVVCPKCFYTWTFKLAYFKYPGLGIWKWRRMDMHWMNVLGYSVKDTSICVAHGMNRILYTMLDLTLGQNEDHMRVFASLFEFDTPIDSLKSKEATKHKLREIGSFMQSHIDIIERTNSGIIVSEVNHQTSAQNNGVGIISLEFSQILFKMADKIIVSCSLWLPYMLRYLERYRLENNSTMVRHALETQQRFLGVEQRNINDQAMRELWQEFQKVWVIIKADRQQWINWKRNGYIYPREVLASFQNKIFLNARRASGIADYVHIICCHLIELFDAFELAN